MTTTNGPANDDRDRDPLTFLPIPIATGEVHPSPATGKPEQVTSLSVTVTLANGETVVLPITYRGGGWRMG